MKEYITSILYIGAFGIILELILPKTKLKKYIISILSILIIIAIISPIKNVLNGNEALDDVLEDICDSLNIDYKSTENKAEYEAYNENISVSSSIKKSTEERLLILFSDTLKDKYDVEKVNVVLNNENELQNIYVYILNSNVTANESELKEAEYIVQKLSTECDVPSNLLIVVM